MPDEPIVVLENCRVNEKYFKLTFRSESLSREAEPGQFVNLQINPPLDFKRLSSPNVSVGDPSLGFPTHFRKRTSSSSRKVLRAYSASVKAFGNGMCIGVPLDPFLRRPFSYYRIRGNRVEILYEILGCGTAVLAGKKKGDRLRAMGPLGLPFSVEIKKKKRVLVAGGVGVPPLVFLAERHPTDYLLIGCRSKNEVLPKKELARVKAEISYATDDGSCGTKGLVTQLIEKLLKKESPSRLFIQTCGPKAMMQAVLEMARRMDLEGEASVDETMACGVGSCLGCMVKTREGWTPSCTQGPVFRFDALETIVS